MIVAQFGGIIPSDLESLRSLPGIGRYTAGAIASIAYQQPVPLVDGNVFRVLSRVFNCKDDISKPKTQKKFYELAAGLISEKEPGNFNQALMELGSLICISETPRCPLCPVKSLCISFKEGDPSQLPVRANHLTIKKMEMVVGLLTQKDRILVRRRPASGIWGGLWELPGAVRKKGESLEQSLQNEFLNEIGIALKIKKKIKPMEHRFTHRLAKIHPFECKLENGHPIKIKNRELKWADQNALKKLSFPVPHQKIISNYNLTALLA